MITELEFQSLARAGYHRIPLVTEAFADLETPLSLYLKLAHAHGDGTTAFCWNRSRAASALAATALLACPRALCCAPAALATRAKTEVVTDGQVVETHHGNPLDFIAAYQQR